MLVDGYGTHFDAKRAAEWPRSSMMMKLDAEEIMQLVSVMKNKRDAIGHRALAVIDK